MLPSAFGFELLILLSTSAFASDAIQCHRSLATTKTASGIYHSARSRGLYVDSSEILVETPIIRSDYPDMLTRQGMLGSSPLIAHLSNEKSRDIGLPQYNKIESSWRPSIQRRGKEKTTGESPRDMSKEVGKIYR